LVYHTTVSAAVKFKYHGNRCLLANAYAIGTVRILDNRKSHYRYRSNLGLCQNGANGVNGRVQQNNMIPDDTLLLECIDEWHNYYQKTM